MSEIENRPGRSRIAKLLPYLFAGGIAALVSVLIYAGVQYTYTRSPDATAKIGTLDNPAAAQLGPEGTLLKKTSESFRLIAKKVGPAVVNIKSTKRPTTAGRRGLRQRGGEDEESPYSRDPFFEFFERFGQPFPFPQQEGPQTSVGSGILVDKAGIVVTNNHVVAEANEILVTFNGQKTDIKAKIIGTDPKTDLAVLKLESTKDLPEPAVWADSSSVEVGDWAIAIGSPFALGQSVTVGIVSAIGGRNSMALAGTEYGGDLIQTDAAINPGNSGGPLCDLEGKIIGVNTAIYTRSGGYMGIGFAIPSDLARDVTSKLAKDGKIVRGWLGVYIQPLDEELGKELGVKQGVGIHEVLEESPAAKAGLRAGDAIVQINGKDVTEVTALQKMIAGFKPGQKIEMRVVSYADKKTKNVTVNIGELPDSDSLAEKGSAPADAAPDKLGLVVTKGKNGLVVEAVQPGSMGEQVGLEVGDILVTVNRKKLDTLANYRKLLGGSKKIYLEVKREGRTLFYQFTLPK
ncbi:trypsin-like peptidase domain-containing protein [bacterium]|nr:trypsin-like peptidase domain-containing protein [bacterium]